MRTPGAVCIGCPDPIRCEDETGCLKMRPPGLPEDDAARKAIPIDAIFRFWPDALIELARHIQFGADKYANGVPVWNRELSSDHKGSAFRHQIDLIKSTSREERLHHQVAIVWREISQLQLDCEEQEGFE